MENVKDIETKITNKLMKAYAERNDDDIQFWGAKLAAFESSQRNGSQFSTPCFD